MSTARAEGGDYLALAWARACAAPAATALAAFAVRFPAWAVAFPAAAIGLFLLWPLPRAAVRLAWVCLVAFFFAQLTSAFVVPLGFAARFVFCAALLAGVVFLRAGD